MPCRKTYILSLIFITVVNYLPAQDITGTWQGNLGNDQFIQVNVIQVKDKLCGYTWDYVYKRQNDYCKAYFTGEYDRKRKEWVLEGTSFIVDSIGHSLMHIRLKQVIENGKTTLQGYSTVKAKRSSGLFDIELSLSGIFSGIFSGRNIATDDITLEKVSEMPVAVLSNMNSCMTDYLLQRTTLLEPVRHQADTIKNVALVEPVGTKPPDSIKTTPEIKDRSIKEIKHLVFNTSKITLDIYDNAITDGDTVTIFYNDKLLMQHQRLSERPITINLELNGKDTLNKLVLHAENLGSIPPNTALIIVTAGSKRYELFSSASLTESSMLVFEYRPGQ